MQVLLSRLSIGFRSVVGRLHPFILAREDLHAIFLPLHPYKVLGCKRSFIGQLKTGILHQVRKITTDYTDCCTGF